ncbi:MAG: hypothetical protein LQ349_007839 [Xanthoria aureola]|nr:MAG: hypothetical protein LQ349_007839 [Xanthoria aureola]
MAAVIGPASPSHSPRLPSPPPFPEVQIGPPSPSARINPGSSNIEHDDATRHDHAAARRIRPGTKAADMAAGPPLLPLSQLDSAFQLQEHLKALYASFTRPEKGNTSVPINAETAHSLAREPDGVDPLLWLYELCRLLVVKENDVLVGFFNESPACTKDTCPEMRASEWQYLCAVHDPPKPCCAIDYCIHTLDWAGNQLTSTRNFPSRLTLGSQATGGSQGGLRVLTNIMRRCYRIFAHAWYQHRQVFWNIENTQGLYIFFKTVCEVYNLLPHDGYTIPLDAEGIASSEEESNDFDRSSNKNADNDQSKGEETEATTTTISTGATTRRHKHTPSTGSAVTTIAEGREDDDDEHHSPDRDVPLEILPSSASKTTSATNMAESPSADKAGDADDGDVKVPELDTKAAEKPDVDTTSGEKPAIETMNQDA